MGYEGLGPRIGYTSQAECTDQIGSCQTRIRFTIACTKINDYFVRNDPYRHPTTASLAGDKFWPAGYAVADIPQMHVYAAQKDALKMGDSIADWTARMWQEQARPNVVGEFGTTNS